MAYLTKAWEAYRSNFTRISALGIVAVLIAFGAAFVKLGILSAYITILLQIATYKIVEKRVMDRNLAIQALWAWIAQIIVAIILVLIALAVAIVCGIGLLLVAKSAAIVGAIILGIALVVVALRFIFIPYFAHKGYGLLKALEKSWKLGWGPAIRVGIESLVIVIASLALAGIVFYPVAKSMILAAKQAYQTGVYASPTSIMHAMTAQLVTGRHIILTAISVLIIGLAQPMYWLIAYYGAKERENT